VSVRMRACTRLRQREMNREVRESERGREREGERETETEREREREGEGASLPCSNASQLKVWVLWVPAPRVQWFCGCRLQETGHVRAL